MDPRLQEILNKFTSRELTGAINHIPPVPTRIGQMGLFTKRNFRTNAVELDEVNGSIEILDPSVRDSPPAQLGDDTRETRLIPMSYFSKEFVVRPEEVEGLRAEGSRTELVQVADVVNQKLARIRQIHDVTLEYEMMGAIKGIITKKDGVTTRQNLFTLFNVTQQTEDFLFGTSTTDLKAKTRSAVRKSKIGLGGGMSANGYVSLCGVDFFDKLTNHPSVKELYLNQPRSAELNTPDRFSWQGITWESYDGSVNGADFIAAGEAYLVPLGVPGLLETLFGPANTMDSVNQVAQELYIQRDMLKYNKGISALYESNHISICKKPKSIIKLYSSN